MPSDKWGIPFIYPSKATAGLTTNSPGFFWQQNNNVLNDDGMIRFGKELDRVHVINSTTGEWEFPFLAEGDGLSMSGPTGHHSGGETHGCQGFAYMCDTVLESSNPTFRFRKETYHVQYNTDPKTGSDWSHPAATGPCVNHWKGMCWVRYNKKDGRGPGADSVICEMWWCDDPDNDKTKWTMLKRTEDLGDGRSNWGVGATCDGTAHQVGTWSNVQFRFKSAASDFSLHPYIRETNDDPDVHSIGGENMSFADSEKRGYGKRADMPRDIEMKCLVKWDAGGAGKAHFKNISLREIDPTIGFDDPNPTPGPTPTPTPQPGEEPPTNQTITGKFKLQWDLNTIRASACQGTGTGTEPVPEEEEPTGGGGGTSGNTRFYTITATDNDKELTNNSTFDNRTRITEKCGSSSSILKGNILKQLDVKLKKAGSPGASPTVKAKIWNSSGSVVYTSPTTIDPTTLTTSFVKKSFDFAGNTHAFVVGDRVGIEYTGTSSSNYIQVPWVDDTIDGESGSYVSQWESGSWDDKNSRDMSCEMWE